MSVSILLSTNERMFEFVWTQHEVRKEALIIARDLDEAEKKLFATYGITSYTDVANL
ncbi:hypothetical protein M2277_005088 [Paenibacillus sp. LBL]|nr:hypothetical protein [Paenibacillus sp. LBL]